MKIVGVMEEKRVSVGVEGIHEILCKLFASQINVDRWFSCDYSRRMQLSLLTIYNETVSKAKEMTSSFRLLV